MKPDFEVEDSTLIEYHGKSENVTIPDGITSIGEGAFRFRRKLNTVIIPDSVTEIGKEAFYYCDNLTSITIGRGVTNIGNNVIVMCYNLTSIQVSEQNPIYASIDGILYDKNIKTLIHCPAQKNSVIIPDTVTSIEKSAFSGCRNLTSVTLPDSVTRIGDMAFDNCTSLTSFTIPDSVTSFGFEVFYNCPCETCVKYHDTIFSLENTTMVTDATDILRMIKSRNFSIRMNPDVKYSVVCSIFLNQPDDEPTTTYIKKNFSRIFHYLIQMKDIDSITNLIHSGKFLTKRNIDKYIDEAITNGYIELQVLLMDYKAHKIGYSDPMNKFKL